MKKQNLMPMVWSSMLALFGGMLAGYAERYEAEEAVYSRTIFTENATASGGAYLDGYQGVSVSWTVEHDGGEVGLSFGIKIPYGTVRSMGVFVNGAQVGSIGSVSQAWEVASVTATLVEGTNTIQLLDSEGTAEPDIDYVDIVPLSQSFEAEDLTIAEGFALGANTAASSGQILSLSAGSGRLTQTMETGGVYDITLSYFDENDGEAEYKIYIDNVLVDAWAANKDYGFSTPITSNLTSHTTRAVSVPAGAVVEIVAYSDEGELCCVDTITYELSATDSSTHGITWNADGTVASLTLGGVEQLTATTGTQQFRFFNGEMIRTTGTATAEESNGVVVITDASRGDLKMLFRVEGYEHHCVLRMIGLEEVPLNDASIGIRMTLPTAGGFNILALDDYADAEQSETELQLDWARLGDRKRFPGGVFALYADGTAEENALALEEIKEEHGYTVTLMVDAVNGVPVSWLTAHGLDATKAATLLDSDQDGLTVLEEYLAGTSPLDSTSKFNITDRDLLSDTVSLTWPTVTGKTYSVWFSADLTADSWVEVASGIEGADVSMAIEIPAETTEQKLGFYRVEVE